MALSNTPLDTRRAAEDGGAHGAAARSSPLKILLIDDHPLWREGVSGALRRLPLPVSVDVVQASSGRQALELLARPHDIALVLLDLSMPQMDGLSTLKALRDLAPQLRVVMLSASESADDVRRCIAAGALGYLSKGCDEAQLAAALSVVMAGCVYVPPLMLAASTPPATVSTDAPAAAPAPSVPQAPNDVSLTPRQRAVLHLLCDGQTNKQISQALGLSEKTTKAHVGAIFRALGVVNRTQAALRARPLLAIKDLKAG